MEGVIIKKILVLLFILCVGVGAYFFWQHYENAKLKVDHDFLTLYGNVEIRRVNLGFRVSGRINEILFKEGEQIKKNEVIARLDKEPFEDNIAVAQAQIQTAEANYEKLKSGNRPQEIEQAKATVNQQEAVLKVLEADFVRAKLLITNNTISRQEYDTILARRDEAVASKELAEATLNLLVEGFRREDIAAGKSKLAEAKANLKRQQTSLHDTELLCPNDGVLLTRVEEPGAVVGSGQTVATLSLRDEVWVYVYIPENMYGIVESGMKAEIYTDAKLKKTDPVKMYTGHVGSISPEAEFTPKTVQTTELRTDLVFRVRIIADTPDGGLGQGMPVTVKLHLNHDPN